jgi:hypothetical protein
MDHGGFDFPKQLLYLLPTLIHNVETLDWPLGLAIV